MDRGAIQAGEAVVAITGDDSGLRNTLATTPGLIETAAARVSAAAAAGTSAVSAAALATSTSIARASTLTGALSGATARAAALARTGWTAATGSVGGMTVALGSALALTKAIGLQSTLTGRAIAATVASGSLLRAGGFVASLAGAVTGSSRLRAVGQTAGRLGIAAGLVDGFQRSGFRGLIGSAISSGLQSAIGGAAVGSIGLARRTLGGIFRLPGNAARGILTAFSAVQTGAASILPGLSQVSATAAQTNQTLANGGGVVRAFGAQLSGFASSLLSAGRTLAGFGLAGVVAAQAAATSFARTTKEITAHAQSAGISVSRATDEIYGTSLAGQLISRDDIAAGETLASTLSMLSATASVAWAQIGAAAAPTMNGILQETLAIVQGVALWLNQNRELVASTLRVGLNIAQAATVVGVLAAGFWALAPAVGVVLSPLGLLTAGIVAGIYAWTQYTDSGAAALDAVGTAVTNLSTITNTTIGGIVDALAAGDLGLAAEVGLAGVTAAFHTVTSDVRSLWTNLSASLADILVGSGWMETLNSAVTFVENQLTTLTTELSNWVVWFQQQAGLIDEAKAEATKAANIQARDQTIAARNAATARDNETFRTKPDEVRDDLKTERDARLAAIQAEKEAAETRLRELRVEAATTRGTVDQSLAVTAVSKGPEKMTEAVYSATRTQFGAGGLAQAGTNQMKALETATKKVADNTAETNDLLRSVLAYAP